MNAWPGSFLWVLISSLALACLIAVIVMWWVRKEEEASAKRIEKILEKSHARIMEQSQQYLAARKNYPRNSFSPGFSPRRSPSDLSSSVYDAIIYSSFFDSSNSNPSYWSDSGSYSSDSSSSSCSDSSSSSSSDSSSSSCSSSSSFD